MSPREISVAQTRIGYLALHLLGLSMGTLLLPASPSVFKRQLKLLNSNSNDSTRDHQMATKRQPGKTAIELCSYAFIWWVLYGLSTLLRRHYKAAVSRRLVCHLPARYKFRLTLSRPICPMFSGLWPSTQLGYWDIYSSTRTSFISNRHPCSHILGRGKHLNRTMIPWCQSRQILRLLRMRANHIP